MDVDGLPDWSEVAATIEQLALANTPAELHGALCGWLAGGGGSADDWLRSVMADADLPLTTDGDVLDRLRKASADQLEDPQFGFQLLLPEDARISVRAEALFSWCRGFLGGFGLAAGNPTLSDEGQEALRDVGNLAFSQMEDEGDRDDAEALGEIEEYLRVAVLLLHADCTMASHQRHRLH